MPLYKLEGISPEVHESAFVAPGANLIGRVRVGARASLWFGVVARGDTENIVIGEGSNVQDGTILHADPGFPCVLEENVTVGHRAIVHGAICKKGSLVGMGAIMLNGSSLGEGAVLGAGALLGEGKSVPAGMLAVGIPARVIREVHAPDNAEHYQDLSQKYKAALEGLF